MMLVKRRWFFAVAILLTLAGCAANRSNSAPVAIATPAGPAPLDLCPDLTQSQPDAPASVANQPGYTQLAISVTDASGKPVPGLRQSDFSVDLLGKHLPIVYFAGEEHSAPTSLVVVMDESGSMYGKLVAPPDMLAAIRGKISAVVGGLNRCDEVALVMASGALVAGGEPNMHKVRVLQPFTTGHTLPLRYLYEYTPYGETSLYDAIDLGLQTAAGAHYRQRALIVISDGIDNSSTTKKDQLAARLRQSRIEFFAVGIGDPSAGENPQGAMLGALVIEFHSVGKLDAKDLSDLATAANGQFIEASSLRKDQGQSFAKALQKVSDNLGSSYLIGVVVPSHVEAPSAPPNVTVPSRPDAVVTTRVIPAAQSLGS
jgi:VWFA-related protein